MLIRTILLLFISNILSGQYLEDSIRINQSIDTVWISSQRLPSTLKKNVRSINVINVDPLKSPASLTSINDLVEEVPGLFILNGQNYAQDSRIAIRGFGSRSAFGIRGVKLIVDGIPETTPDGQGQLDNLNLSSIRKIEVIKGAASSIYGNASGGVIHISTLEDIEEDYPFSVNVIKGSYGLNRYDFSAGLYLGKTKVIGHLDHLDYKGYRAHSDVKNTSANVRLIHPLKNGILDIIVNHTDSPLANDPGGINIESVEAERSQARDRNVLFGAGESIKHSKASISYKHELSGKQSINTYGFLSKRDFNGFLPFQDGGVIDLSRMYWGHGTNYAVQKISAVGVLDINLGYDIAIQSDSRMRFENIEGIIGDQTLTQQEKFNNYGVFISSQYSISNWVIDAGLRYDINELSVDDRFIVDGDDTDAINLNNFNFNIGLNHSVSDQLAVYSNYSTSFETPTLSELSANPIGGGFNSDLNAQTAQSIEIGLRLGTPAKNYIDLTFYVIDTDNELLPFELEQFPGRDFFRNAGSTIRRGVELYGQYHVNKNIIAHTSYTFGKYKFNDFVLNGVDLNGNNIPGLPESRFTFSAEYQNDLGFSVRAQFLSTSSIFLRNDNTISADAYELLNLFISHEVLVGQFKFLPLIGINNLLNEEYFSNVRINAFGSRFYEPGPERSFFAGVKVLF